MIGGQALFVETVAGFVQNAEEGGGEVVLVVTGGETDIAWPERGAEGMGRGIDATLGEIKTDGLSDFAVEGLLVGDGRGTT